MKIKKANPIFIIFAIDKFNYTLLYTQIKYDASEYWQALRMREIELRLPLGRRYSIEDIQKEKEEWFFAAIQDEIVLASCQFVTENVKAKMRQVATKKSHQGTGIGRGLYLCAEDLLCSHGIEEIYCHARITAIEFYKRMGFEIYSEEFMEVGIPHVKMRKSLNRNI